MSVQLIAWAYEQKTGSLTEKAVLLALANASNGHTGRCHPSITRLSQEIEGSEKTVRRALKSLEEKGFIERVRARKTDGTLGVYSYRFPMLDSDDPPPVRESGSPPVTVTALEPEVDLEPSAPNGAAANPQELLAHFIDHARESGADPPRRVVGQLAREIKKLVDEGATEEELRAALDRLFERSLSPSMLASVLFDVRTRGGPADGGDVLGSFLAKHENSWPTGSRMVRGQNGVSFVQDPLGYDKPTHAVPWQRPTRNEIISALRSEAA